MEFPPERSTRDETWIGRRERFYERTLGPPREPAVYHWDDDGDPHIDVYAYRGSAERPFETLVTGGMADRPMPGVVLDDDGPARRIELLVRMERSEDWAAILLREMAAVPFLVGRPLAPHALVLGNRPICAGSSLRHALLVDAEEPGLGGFIVEGEEVRFLSLCFVTEEEYMQALRRGPAWLEERLRRTGATRILDPKRPSVA